MAEQMYGLGQQKQPDVYYMKVGGRGNVRNYEVGVFVNGKLLSIRQIDDRHIEMTVRNDKHYHPNEDVILYEIEMERDCCESRYFHTDDDLPPFIGAFVSELLLTKVKLFEVLQGDDEDEELYKESGFMRISTNLGDITFQAYNIHTGYYTGFDLRVTETEM